MVTTDIYDTYQKPEVESTGTTKLERSRDGQAAWSVRMASIHNGVNPHTAADLLRQAMAQKYVLSSAHRHVVCSLVGMYAIRAVPWYSRSEKQLSHVKVTHSTSVWKENSACTHSILFPPLFEYSKSGTDSEAEVMGRRPLKDQELRPDEPYA